MKEGKHLLFPYDTLQLEKVQLESSDRTLKGTSDRLIGYTTKKTKITDMTVLANSQLDHHTIAVRSCNETDFLEETLLETTDIELSETANYEVSEYHRILETLESVKRAWVYVAKNTGA